MGGTSEHRTNSATPGAGTFDPGPRGTPSARMGGRELSPLGSLARQALGCDLLTVIDIGARGRLLPAFEPIAEATHIVGFEPDEPAAEELERVRHAPWAEMSVVRGAVSGVTEERTLYRTRRPSLSSLLRPTVEGEADWEVVEILDVPARTMADWVDAGELPPTCDYLKLDVQGAEHEILSSVPEDLWEGLAGIEVECRFRRHYSGQRHALEVVDLVRVRGFEVATLHPVFRGGQVVDRRAGGPATARTLSHADVLCVRPTTWPGTRPDPRRAAAALLLVHAVHGLWQEAREVVSCYLPELSDAVQACLPRDESPVSWRVAVLVRSLQLVFAPTRARRFDLAAEALRVDGPSSSWRLSAPKL